MDLIGDDYDVDQVKIDVAQAKIQNKENRKVEVEKSDVVEVEGSVNIDLLYN